MLAEFIRTHNFGVLIVVQDGLPGASHLPFVLNDREDPWRLAAHVSVENPLTQRPLGGARAAAIFSGPHAYVSAGWYSERNRVPTWNYQAVYAYGTLRLLSDPRDATAHVTALSEQHEGTPPSWSIDRLKDTEVARRVARIQAFELVVESVYGQFKLSQDKKPAEREEVRRGLLARGDAEARAVVAAMLAFDPPAD